LLQYSEIDYIAEYLGYKAISRSSWLGFVNFIVTRSRRLYC